MGVKKANELGQLQVIAEQNEQVIALLREVRDLLAQMSIAAARAER